MARTALHVDEVWERLESVKDYVKQRRQIDLSKRDIELLLDYRDDRKNLTDELNARIKELDCIKRMMQHIPRDTEDSLRDLIVTHNANGSNLTNQLFKSMVLAKVAKLAMDHCTSIMAKAGFKAMIHRDMNSNPGFYGIVKENFKKRDPTFDKDIERLTKVALWIGQQSEKSSVKKKSTAAPSAAGVGSSKVRGQEHKTPRETQAARSDGAASKATNNPPQTQTAPSKPAASATSFQCNLLFGTHPATKHLTTSNKFKKLPTLEDKLRFILDDFESSRPNAGKAMTVTQIKPADLSSSQQNKVSKSQQTTETMSSLEEQLRGARSSPIKKVERGVTFAMMSDSLEDEEDMCSIKGTELTELIAIREQYKKILESTFGGDTFESGRFDLGRKLKLNSPPQNLPNIVSDHDDSGSLVGSQSYSVTSTELEDLLALQELYSKALETTRSPTSLRCIHQDMRSLTSSGLQQLLSVREEYSKISHDQNNNYLTAGHSIRSMRSFRSTTSMSHRSLPSARKVKTSNQETQTIDIPSPIKRDSVGNTSTESLEDLDLSRISLSPDSEHKVTWMVSNKLDSGQWRQLFTKLMLKTEDADEEDIEDDIAEIEEKTSQEKYQSIESMRIWRQTNGTFDVIMLIETLRQIRRKDIAKDLLDYFSRQSRM